MKANRILLLLGATLLFAPGCDLIGGIIKFSFVVGIITVILVLAVIMFVFRKIRGR